MKSEIVLMITGEVLLGANLTLCYNILEDLELSVAGNYMHSSTLQEQWWGEKAII